MWWSWFSVAFTKRQPWKCPRKVNVKCEIQWKAGKDVAFFVFKQEAWGRGASLSLLNMTPDSLLYKKNLIRCQTLSWVWIHRWNTSYHTLTVTLTLCLGKGVVQSPTIVTLICALAFGQVEATLDAEMLSGLRVAFLLYNFWNYLKEEPRTTQIHIF